MFEEKVYGFERIISALSYLTGGLVGFIFFIIITSGRKQASKFLLFNIWQSLFLSMLIYFILLLLQFSLGILVMIPVLNVLLNMLHSFLTNPVVYGFSISSGFVAVVYFYLILYSLLGKVAYLPWVSDVIIYQLKRF